MAHAPDTYADRFRKAVSAGMSQTYIEAVNNGEVEKVDKARLDSCWRAVDKCVPNPPQSTITHEAAAPPDFYVIHPKD